MKDFKSKTRVESAKTKKNESAKIFLRYCMHAATIPRASVGTPGSAAESAARASTLLFDVFPAAAAEAEEAARAAAAASGILAAESSEHRASMTAEEGAAAAAAAEEGPKATAAQGSPVER